MVRKRNARKSENPFAFVDFVEELLKYESFLKTRRAIHRGVTLYEYPWEVIRSRGLLGPWSTNFYESTIAAIPSVILLWIIDIFRRPVPMDDAIRIALKLNQVVIPFVFPLAMMFLAGVASWASLYPKDRTIEKRENAKYAYLYLDGTHGLLAQTFFTTALALFSGIYRKEPMTYMASFFEGISTLFANLYGVQLPPDEIVPLGEFLLALLCLVAMFWNIRFNWYMIPSKLFKIHGYSGIVPKAHKKEPPNSGPWSQYRLAVLFFGAVILQVLYFIFGFICGLLGVFLSLFVT